MLVERASGNEGSDYLLELDERVPPRAMTFYEEMLERRASGEPLQYVLGRWGFRRLDLYVDNRVLIPRPETETVVQAAIDETKSRLGRKPVVVDLGTGSGAIALALALEVPGSEVWAVDASPDALTVARANLAGAGTLVARRVRILEGSWFDPLPRLLEGRVQLIVANPPYIADDEELAREVEDWEPRDALRAGPTGLECIELIVEHARNWLAEPGALVVEIAPHQAAKVLAIAREAGFNDVNVLHDLSGRERTLVARV